LLVATEHAGPHSIGIIDETGCPKKGEKTPVVRSHRKRTLRKLRNIGVTIGDLPKCGWLRT
jgi:hypothetical protein